MSLIEIILRAKSKVIGSAVINAMWVEGSYATGTFDNDSDIDVWIDIIPGMQEQALSDFEQAIQSITSLREITSLTYYSDDPKLAKAKLYFENQSDNNRIELDIQESTQAFVFDRTLHDLVVIFDKTGAVAYGA